MDAHDQTLLKKVEDLERTEILRSLEQTGGVISHAALKLGITERMMYYKMKKYGIRRSDFIKQE